MQQEPQTQQDAQSSYKYHIFRGDNPMDSPTPIIEWNESPSSRNSRLCVYKQRKFNYLKLHIQTTNTKRFSPVAIDNIITEFVFCPKILLHAAILQNPTAHSQISTTHFVSQNTVF